MGNKRRGEKEGETDEPVAGGKLGCSFKDSRGFFRKVKTCEGEKVYLQREKLHGGWESTVKFIEKQPPRVDWHPGKSFSVFVANIGIGTTTSQTPNTSRSVIDL